MLGTETVVAVAYKRPSETPPPMVMPVRAESIPIVYKVPPSDPPLSLGPVSGAPRADPTTYKEPPRMPPPSLAPENVVQVAPVVVPAGTASGA